MTIAQAQGKLAQQRIKLAEVQVTIRGLKQFLLASGYDEKKKRLQRNRRIYRQYQRGHTFADIAKQFQLSNTSISVICRKEEREKQYKKY